MLPRFLLSLALLILLAGCATTPPDLPADEDDTDVEYSALSEDRDA